MQQGAALVPALAFMFASANLVVELGAILWLLMAGNLSRRKFLARSSSSGSPGYSSR
ncbi:MAG: hypothetical protein M3R59_05335 [Verrucomicrobiota bacterium]|nr:hypothetical protein [Verrucomicrobiota bacterium]